jgi:hypothetical protein
LFDPFARKLLKKLPVFFLLPYKITVTREITTTATATGISILKRNDNPIRTGIKIAKNFTLSIISPH